MATFRLAGDDLTRIARNMWAEGSNAKAIRLLVDGLGMTEAQAIEVCTGRVKLVGDEHGMDMAPDAAEECPSLTAVLETHAKELSDLRETVTDLVAMNLGETVRMPSPSGQRCVPRRRTKLVKKLSGLIQSEQRKLTAPWEELPVWYDVHEDALDPDDETWGKSLEDSMTVALSENLPNVPGGPDLAQVARTLLRTAPFEVPEPQRTITSPTGWLSPAGLFYPCSYMEHRPLADALAGMQGELGDQPEGQGEGALEAGGWVKLEGQGIVRGPAAHPGLKPLTKTQAGLVLDWCELTGAEYPGYDTRKDDDE